MEQHSYLGSETQPEMVPTSDEKNLALLSHILTFLAPILAPLIIYLIKKDESPFIAAHARESLNFKINVLLVCFLLVITIIGILLVWIIAIAAVVLVIIATIRASEGKLYKYPLTWRLIS